MNTETLVIKDVAQSLVPVQIDPKNATYHDDQHYDGQKIVHTTPPAVGVLTTS